MTELTQAHVLELAKLAKLRLSAQELETYRQHLSDILDYVQQLDALDLSDIDPTTHAHAPGQGWRPDVVEQRLTSAQIIKNAPAADQGQFKVPKVIG